MPPAPQTALTQAFRLYYRPLCLYALHFLRDADWVEDAVQDCFEELWKRLDRGETVQSLQAYLYRMVRNRCLHLLQEQSPVETDVSLIDPEHLPEEEEDWEERSFVEARLWTAIDALPPRCRETLLLSKRDGLKYEEIARRQGTSIQTVKNQISKALKILKEGGRKVCFFFFG